MFREAIPAELIYTVPGVSCSQCQAAIREDVGRVPGVTAVDVNLESKHVIVRGERLDDAEVRHAIAEAGYDVQSMTNRSGRGGGVRRPTR